MSLVIFEQVLYCKVYGNITTTKVVIVSVTKNEGGIKI
jgi:hypothetical protein